MMSGLVESDMGSAQRVKHGPTRKFGERDDNAEQQEENRETENLQRIENTDPKCPQKRV